MNDDGGVDTTLLNHGRYRGDKAVVLGIEEVDGQCLVLTSLDFSVRILKDELVGILTDMETTQHVVLERVANIMVHEESIMVLTEQLEHVILMIGFRRVSNVHAGEVGCKVRMVNAVTGQQQLFLLVVIG